MGSIRWRWPDGDVRSFTMTGFLLGVAAAMLFGPQSIFAKFGLGEVTPSIVGFFVKTDVATMFFVSYAAVKDEFEFGQLQWVTQWLMYTDAGVANTTFFVAITFDSLSRPSPSLPRLSRESVVRRRADVPLSTGARTRDRVRR